MSFLVERRRGGKRVVGYGAPGKGNTLLNHCGIRSDLLRFTVDRNPHKHGMFLPGTHIPIRAGGASSRRRARTTSLILPWNLRARSPRSSSYVRDWGGRLVVPLPRLEVF